MFLITWMKDILQKDSFFPAVSDTHIFCCFAPLEKKA